MAFTADDMIRNILLSLQGLLQKTADLDIYDELLFNYKIKSDLAGLDEETINGILDVTQECFLQLQDITQKYISKNNVAVAIIQISTENSDYTDNLDLATRLALSQQQSLLQETDKNVKDKDDELGNIENEMLPKKRGRPKGSYGWRRNPSRKLSAKEKLKMDCERKLYGTRSKKEETPSENDSSTVPRHWECILCSRIFSSKARLTTHMTSIHKSQMKSEENGESKKRKAPLIRKTSKQARESEDEEDDMELDKASLSVFCCNDCLITYKTRTEFMAHVCKINNDEDKEPDEPMRTGEDRLIRSWEQLKSLRSLLCGMCMEEYRSLRRMVHHLNNCKPGPYECELCPLDFPNKCDLNYHKKKAHENEKSFFCDFCDLSFKLRTSLQKHLVTRHESNQGPFSCSSCGEIFEKRINLTNHRVKYHGLSRKFLCQVCGNKFSTQSSLMAHIGIHSELRSFTCDYCSKSFRRKDKLKYHTRIHTGEKPHKCPSCNKRFIRKSKLEEHIRRHKGLRPFSCEHCSKKYAAGWDLRQHILKIHSKKEEEEEPEEVIMEQVDPDIGPIEETMETLVAIPMDAVPLPTINIVDPLNISTASAPTTIVTMSDQLQLATLDSSTTQFIQLASNNTPVVGGTALQIQVPITMTQSFDYNQISNESGQQIVFTNLGNFDVTSVGNIF